MKVVVEKKNWVQSQLITPQMQILGLNKHMAYLLTHPVCTWSYLHTQTHTNPHSHTDSAVWLINSFLCWGGVMTADSSQSPEDQRVTPLIK